MKDDDKIEVVDLSPEGDAEDSLKDFLNEQMKHMDGLIAAVRQAGRDETPVEALAAYVRGAIAASNEAIAVAWPDLRDEDTISSENRRKVNMTGALCGMIILPKAQELASEPDRDLRAIGLLIMLQMQKPQIPGPDPSAIVAKAVTLRATADELTEQARKEEAE